MWSGSCVFERAGKIRDVGLIFNFSPWNGGGSDSGGVICVV
jgi:hypothetical protein